MKVLGEESLGEKYKQFAELLKIDLAIILAQNKTL